MVKIRTWTLCYSFFIKNYAFLLIQEEFTMESLSSLGSFHLNHLVYIWLLQMEGLNATQGMYMTLYSSRVEMLIYQYQWFRIWIWYHSGDHDEKYRSVIINQTCTFVHGYLHVQLYCCYFRLCLSISDFHPDTWNPAWSVSTILTGLLSFMVSILV